MTSQSLTLPAPSLRRSRNPLVVIWHEMKYGLITLPRSPAALAVTVFFPLIFNVLFNIINADRVVNGAPNVQFTTAAVVVFVIFATGYFANSVSIVVARETGILRRVRLTPISGSIYLGARILFSALTAAVSIAMMIAVSIVVFGLRIHPIGLVGLFVTFLLGCFACAVLGMAITRFMATVEAAVGISMATMLPLMFISGVFFPVNGLPEILRTVLGLLPVQPMVESVRLAFRASAGSPVVSWPDLAVLFAWALVGTVFVGRTMRWEPRR
jgi:ABC-2 type transport system permease protein